MSLSLDLVPYGGWTKAVRMRRDGWELIAPLEIGPRILRFGPIDGSNVLFENKEQMGKTGAQEWMIYGGHRLWTAPENEQCYALDNDRVSFELLPEKGCRLTGEKNEKFGWQKSMEIIWNPDGLVQIEHRLMNSTGKALPVSPWCLTVLNQGGVAMIPQPAYVPHPIDLPKGAKFSMDDYLPNRNLTLWNIPTWQTHVSTSVGICGPSRKRKTPKRSKSDFAIPKVGSVISWVISFSPNGSPTRRERPTPIVAATQNFLRTEISWKSKALPPKNPSRPNPTASTPNGGTSRK